MNFKLLIGGEVMKEWMVTLTPTRNIWEIILKNQNNNRSKIYGVEFVVKETNTVIHEYFDNLPALYHSIKTVLYDVNYEGADNYELSRFTISFKAAYWDEYGFESSKITDIDEQFIDKNSYRNLVSCCEEIIHFFNNDHPELLF